jgi:FKBP-type peptidyl-prolyl cis-trans isomerase SlyD
MQIAKNSVVTIDYTLTDDSGTVLDSSEGREPLSYLHGSGGIIPGLECELDGKQIGEQLKVAVSPEDGYGIRNDALCQEVPRSHFDGIEGLEVGMRFRVDSDAGPMVITVMEIGDDSVSVDGNHPLAGVNLNFAVTVREVREATEEELAHGHVHGTDGGHCG